MDVRQQDVERIVVEVLKKMMSDQPTAAATTVVAASGCDCGDFGLFDRLEDAVQAAEAAQKKISTVAMRDKIIAAIRKAGLENAKAFAEIAHNETGMGRVSDKIAKNILVCERTPGTECLSPMAISGDMGLTLIENAPWGVIASVTPSTNPTATVINNAISMIAGGNSVIFAPHPNAKRASQTAIQVLNKAIIEATGVANLLVAVKEPTIEVAQELFSHPRIKLLVVTGGEAVVAQARKVATHRRRRRQPAGRRRRNRQHRPCCPQHLRRRVLRQQHHLRRRKRNHRRGFHRRSAEGRNEGHRRRGNQP